MKLKEVMNRDMMHTILREILSQRAGVFKKTYVGSKDGYEFADKLYKDIIGKKIPSDTYQDTYLYSYLIYSQYEDSITITLQFSNPPLIFTSIQYKIKNGELTDPVSCGI